MKTPLPKSVFAHRPVRTTWICVSALTPHDSFGMVPVTGRLTCVEAHWGDFVGTPLWRIEGQIG